MKNKLITLTFCILAATNALKAQDDPYIPLLDTGKLWVEAMRMEFGDFSIYERWTGERVIYNDTVYYELWDGSSFPMYFREDTIERKVYIDCYDYPGPCEDILLYDFSLQVGDSIDLGSGYLYVDSVSFLNSKFRTIYLGHPDWAPSYLAWTEGIGSLAGILNTRCMPGLTGMGQTELNCYYKSDSMLYQSYWASLYGCHFEYLAIDEFKQQDIKIYPNPVSYISAVYFPNPEKEIFTLDIYNSLGKMICSRQTSSNKFEISASEFNPGIYILHLSNSTNIHYSEKLIIR